MKKFKVRDNDSGYEYNFNLGQNASENWRLLESSSSWFIFFHLSSFPSCYGILECNRDDKITKSVISQCCEIVKNCTKFKWIKNIGIDYTTCDNVKKGEDIGTVYYRYNRKVSNIKK